MPATVGRRTDRLAPVHRVTRGIDRRTVVRLGIVAAVAYAAWLAIGAFGRPYNFFDMKIYHGAVVWWASGNELYDFVAPGPTLGFTYPPFAGAGHAADGAGCRSAAAGWSTRWPASPRWRVVLAALLAPDRRPATAGPSGSPSALAVPLAAAIEPARETLGYGQVNLLLFAPDHGRPGRPALAGPRGTRHAAADGRCGASSYSGAWAGVGHRPRHRDQAHARRCSSCTC